MGKLSCEHLVQDNARGIDIYPVVLILLSRGLLGRHVIGCPEHGAGPGQSHVLRLRGLELGNAEIEYLYEIGFPRFFYQGYIIGLEVAMNDALGVHRVQGVEHLDDDTRGIIDGQHPVLHETGQAHAVEVLHDNEGAIIVRAHVRDFYDVVMANGSGCPGLVVKPFDNLLIVGDFGEQDFYGQPSSDQHVLRLEDNSHAALADNALDRVFPFENLPDQLMMLGDFLACQRAGLLIHGMLLAAVGAEEHVFSVGFHAKSE